MIKPKDNSLVAVIERRRRNNQSIEYTIIITPEGREKKIEMLNNHHEA